MTPIKRKLLYIFRGSLLRLRITWNHGESITLSLGYHVDRFSDRGKPKWDGSRCVANTFHGLDKVHASIINKVIENLEDKINHAFYQFEITDTIPGTEDMKKALQDDGVKKNTLKEIISEFIGEQSKLNNWSSSMIKSSKVSLRYIITVFGENASLDKIQEKEYIRLLEYFTTMPNRAIKRNADSPEKQFGLSNNSINGILAWIKRFANWAQEKNYCKNCYLASHHKYLKTSDNPLVYLTWDEIKRLYEVDVSNYPAYQEVKDAFCFCCFTGLRYSDVSRLKWSNIKDDRIEIITQKTDDLLSVNLNKFSKEIIERRKGFSNDTNELVFKTTTNHNYNDIIKTLAKMAKIDSPIEIIRYCGNERRSEIVKKHTVISSHTARRTFISNAIGMGIPPDVIMKWTGHKNYKSMKPYINIASSVKKDNMGLFDKLPNLDSQGTDK